MCSNSFAALTISPTVEYTFIQNRFHPMTLFQSKHDFIQWHFHPNTISSNDTFIQNTFIQFWHFHPMTLSTRHFHPTTISSNEFLIQWHFHPMTFSTNNGFIQKKITCGTINIVRVFCEGVAGDAFTQTRLMPRFSGFNRPSCEASPAEGRRWFTWKPVESRKAGV